MSEPQLYATTFYEDGTKYILARIVRKNTSHALVTPATTDFSSITRGIYSLPSTTTISAATTLTTTDVILTANSTANIWTLDGTGFNFIDTIPATALATGNQNVMVEYKFTLTDNTVFPLQVHGPVKPLHGS